MYSIFMNHRVTLLAARTNGRQAEEKRSSDTHKCPVFSYISQGLMFVFTLAKRNNLLGEKKSGENKGAFANIYVLR